MKNFLKISLKALAVIGFSLAVSACSAGGANVSSGFPAYTSAAISSQFVPPSIIDY